MLILKKKHCNSAIEITIVLKKKSDNKPNYQIQLFFYKDEKGH